MKSENIYLNFPISKIFSFILLDDATFSYIMQKNKLPVQENIEYEIQSSYSSLNNIKR